MSLNYNLSSRLVSYPIVHKYYTWYNIGLVLIQQKLKLTSPLSINARDDVWPQATVITFLPPEMNNIQFKVVILIKTLIYFYRWTNIEFYLLLKKKIILNLSYVIF